MGSLALVAVAACDNSAQVGSYTDAMSGSGGSGLWIQQNFSGAMMGTGSLLQQGMTGSLMQTSSPQFLDW